MNNLKRFKWLSVLIILCFVLEQPMLVNSYAKSRKSTSMDSFGMLAGAIIFSKAPASNQSLMRAGLNYLAATQSPKVFKSLGLNQSWQNIGGAALAGAVIGGMNSVNPGQTRFRDMVNPYNWKGSAVLMDTAKWATAGAIQHYGYQKNWDDKIFNGATMLASKIGATGVEMGLSKYGNLGGWAISADHKNIQWLKGNDYNNHVSSIKAGENNPYSASSKFGSLALEGVSLASADLAGRHLGLEKCPEYSMTVGTAMSEMSSNILSGKGFRGMLRPVGTAVLSGVSNLALQQVTQDMGNLGPYAGAMVNLGVTSAIRARLAGGGYELGKQMFMAGAEQAKGSLLTGGIGTLGTDGNIYYNATPDASYAAEMIDFSRAANKQTSSAGRYNAANGGAGVVNAIVNKYFNNLNSQANNNIIGMINDRLDKVKYVKQGDGTYVKQRENNGITEWAPLWNPNAFTTKEYKIQPKGMEKTTAIDTRVAGDYIPAAGSFVSDKDNQDAKAMYEALTVQMKSLEGEKPVADDRIAGNTGEVPAAVLVDDTISGAIFKPAGQLNSGDKVIGVSDNLSVEKNPQKDSAAIDENKSNQGTMEGYKDDYEHLKLGTHCVPVYKRLVLDSNDESSVGTVEATLTEITDNELTWVLPNGEIIKERVTAVGQKNPVQFSLHQIQNKSVIEGYLPNASVASDVQTIVSPEEKTDVDLEILKQEYAESNYPSWLKKVVTNANLGLLVNYSKDERIAMKIKGEEAKLPWNNEWFSPGSISGYLIGRNDKEGYNSFSITEGISKENFIAKEKPSIMKRIIVSLNLGLVFNYGDNEILALQMQGKNPYFFTRHWRAPGTVTGALFGEKGEGYITGANLWFNREAPKKQPDFYVPPTAVTPQEEKTPSVEEPKVEQPKVPNVLNNQQPEMAGPPIPPDYKKPQEKLKKEVAKMNNHKKTALISSEKAEEVGNIMYAYFGGNEEEVVKKLGQCPYSNKTWKEILTDRKPGKGFWVAVEKFQIANGIDKPAKNIGPLTTAAINKFKQNTGLKEGNNLAQQKQEANTKKEISKPYQKLIETRRQEVEKLEQELKKPDITGVQKYDFSNQLKKAQKAYESTVTNAQNAKDRKIVKKETPLAEKIGKKDSNMPNQEGINSFADLKKQGDISSKKETPDLLNPQKLKTDGYLTITVGGKKYAYRDTVDGIREVSEMMKDGHPKAFHPLWKDSNNQWWINNVKSWSGSTYGAARIDTEAVAQIFSAGYPKVWGDDVRSGKATTSLFYNHYYDQQEKKQYFFNKAIPPQAAQDEVISIFRGCSTKPPVMEKNNASGVSVPVVK